MGELYGVSYTSKKKKKKAVYKKNGMSLASNYLKENGRG